MEPTQSLTVRPSVLIVDDSPAMRRYLRVLLESDAYGVETASTGAEAVRRLRSGSKPDVVLLDLQMPGMDGLKTLGELRKLHPAVKVIICSGVEDPLQISLARQLGAHSYLTKPIQHLYLSAALERCLNGHTPAKAQADFGGNLLSFGAARPQ